MKAHATGPYNGGPVDDGLDERLSLTSQSYMKNGSLPVDFFGAGLGALLCTWGLGLGLGLSGAAVTGAGCCC